MKFMSSFNDPAIRHVWPNVVTKKKKAAKSGERWRLYSRDVADAQPTVRPVFYRRHCNLSVRNYCQVIITPLANLINGRSLSLIHVICTYPPERRERLSF